MPGMDMSDAPRLRSGHGCPADFAFIFAMWAIMMIGMMTPSVAPMILLYARVGRKARAGGKPFAATGWFFAGYLAVWIAFSVAATAAQWLLTSFALLTPMMATASAPLGGLVLIAAGLYQWTPLKDVCLRAMPGADRLSRPAMAVSGPIRRARCGSASSMAPTASAAAGR